MPSYTELKGMWEVERELNINRDGTTKDPHTQIIIFTGEKITDNFNNEENGIIDNIDEEVNQE